MSRVHVQGYPVVNATFFRSWLRLTWTSSRSRILLAGLLLPSGREACGGGGEREEAFGAVPTGIACVFAIVYRRGGSHARCAPPPQRKECPLATGGMTRQLVSFFRLSGHRFGTPSIAEAIGLGKSTTDLCSCGNTVEI